MSAGENTDFLAWLMEYPQLESVTLRMRDEAGNLVVVHHNAKEPPGTKSVPWSASLIRASLAGFDVVEAQNVKGLAPTLQEYTGINMSQWDGSN